MKIDGNISVSSRMQPTYYALCCGAVAVAETPQHRVTLWREHGVYHVRVHDFENHERRVWIVTSSLKKARRDFGRMMYRYIRKPFNYTTEYNQ